MSLLFWKKATSENKTATPPYTFENDSSVAASMADPIPVQLIHPDDNDVPPFRIEQEWLPKLSGSQIYRMVQVPGIGTAAAYADGDAFGTLITLHDVFRPEKQSGTVVGILFFDKDDEGLNKDVAFFSRSITDTADNSAFAVTDDDLLAARGSIAVSTWYNWNANQLGVSKDVGLWVPGESTNLYAKVITRGADNIAAGSVPWIGFIIIPD